MDPKLYRVPHTEGPQIGPLYFLETPILYTSGALHVEPQPQERPAAAVGLMALASAGAACQRQLGTGWRFWYLGHFEGRDT